MDPKIADYIARNHGKYTREAIRQQLIDAGHDPADIDATWAILDTPDPDETSVAGEGFWPRFFLFLVGLNVAVFLIVALSTRMLENLAAGGGVLAGIFAVALGIGALIAWGIVAAVGPAKMGRTTALVIGAVIPLVFALLIGGSCFALASGIGPPPRTGTLELDAGDLSGSGPATCYVGQAGGGFSVFGQITGNPPISVDVNTFPLDGGPPTAEVQNVMIFVEDERGTAYGTSGGGAGLDSEVAEEGLRGTVSFSGLRSDAAGPDFEGEAPEPISGTITWTCE